MSNRLFFNAREWSFNKACEKNVGERCFINGIDGKLVEVYTIGNWSWNWTEIISKPMILEKNTEYSFCFWLNGGENDRNDEVCQFRVVFEGDHDNCMIYKLNRSYIKPVKRINGWELYDITFVTGDNEMTQLKFVAQAAYMAIQPAKEPEAYADQPDILDEFDEIRPQRHNIIFEDGWPSNHWYATKELRKKKEAESRGHVGPQFGPDFGNDLKSEITKGLVAEFGPDFAKNIDIKLPNFSNMNFGPENNKNGAEVHFSKMAEDIRKRVQESMMQDIDIDDIVEEIKDDIDMDDIMDEIKDSIDVDSLREEIKAEILKHIKLN